MTTADLRLFGTSEKTVSAFSEISDSRLNRALPCVNVWRMEAFAASFPPRYSIGLIVETGQHSKLVIRGAPIAGSSTSGFANSSIDLSRHPYTNCEREKGKQFVRPLFSASLSNEWI